METRNFGILPDGRRVTLYEISNGKISLGITDFGGRLVFCKINGKNGPVDVILGFDDLQGYLNNVGAYHGALTGRVANRIANAEFTLNGKRYDLFKNDGEHCLHGGKNGFDKALLNVKEIKDGIEMAMISPDGDENFPGNLTVKYTITLKDCGYSINYSAMSDKDTVINLTNHSYYNLSGHGSGSIYDHKVQMYAENYLAVDDSLIPTAATPVAGTPFDLRTPTALADVIAPGKALDGIDHNYCLPYTGKMIKAAKVVSTTTGVSMTVTTNKPGIQLYTGNFLDGATGKNGAKYNRHGALCLETQYYPDAVHHADWMGNVLKANEVYDFTTDFDFSIE